VRRDMQPRRVAFTKRAFNAHRSGPSSRLAVFLRACQRINSPGLRKRDRTARRVRPVWRVLTTAKEEPVESSTGDAVLVSSDQAVHSAHPLDAGVQGDSASVQFEGVECTPEQRATYLEAEA
jgi:hypothetical protein